MIEESLTWTVLVHLRALPTWLTLTRAQRDAVIAEEISPVLGAYPHVRIRWIDVEAFTGDCSDVLIAETADLRDWNHLFEALRDTDVFAKPYFELVRILTGVQDGYLDYEQSRSS